METTPGARSSSVSATTPTSMHSERTRGAGGGRRASSTRTASWPPMPPSSIACISSRRGRPTRAAPATSCSRSARRRTCTRCASTTGSGATSTASCGPFTWRTRSRTSTPEPARNEQSQRPHGRTLLSSDKATDARSSISGGTPISSSPFTGSTSTDAAEDDTDGRFHVLNLVAGERGGDRHRAGRRPPALLRGDDRRPGRRRPVCDPPAARAELQGRQGVRPVSPRIAALDLGGTHVSAGVVDVERRTVEESDADPAARCGRPRRDPPSRDRDRLGRRNERRRRGRRRPRAVRLRRGGLRGSSTSSRRCTASTCAGRWPRRSSSIPARSSS